MIRSLVIAGAALFALAAAAPSAAAVTAEGEGQAAAPEAPHVNWLDFGYKSKDADGGELEAGEHAMAPPFVAVLVNFFIFVGLLVWKAGPPLKNYLHRRHDEVTAALAEAARIKDEAAARLTDYEQRLAKVGREVDELIEGIRGDAEAERARIVAEAEATTAALKKNAQDRIEASIDRARLGLEAEVAGAAIAAAENILRKEMTDDDHNQLVETFIASLSEGGPGAGPAGGGDGGGGAPPEGGRRDSEAVDEGWG